jgi:ribonuclease BN (tRNA processing enzyme)
MTNRRGFLSAIGGVTLGGLSMAAWIPAVRAQSKTRLILLGTGGGPRPRKNSKSTSHAVIVNDVLYVVDCGNGVALQLAAAGVPLTKLRHVFVTHHHSDHNADYGNLLLLSWASGLRTRVDTWGPPPIEKMTRLALELNAYDINIRIEDEGRVPLAPLLHPHELTAAGVVMQDENVKVTCALVDHPPVTPAFGYRFDTADRSIVFSGDTNRSENLVKLAKGADVLVHEAMYVPALDRLVARVPNATTLKKHLVDSHTSVEDCGRVATEAGVKTLVLSHLVPPDDPLVTEQMWIDAARSQFKGEIVVARDLMEI